MEQLFSAHAMDPSYEVGRKLPLVHSLFPLDFSLDGNLFQSQRFQLLDFVAGLVQRTRARGMAAWRSGGEAPAQPAVG